MREATAAIKPSSTIQAMKHQDKARPFGAHFTTKLEGVNGKLVCALSFHTICLDDDEDPPFP
jgi:hypothetical protein